MANRGMGRGSARRTTLGLAMDALLARVMAAEAAASSPVTCAAGAVERIELLCRHGRIDALPNGERRNYPVLIDGAEGRAQVCALGGCLLIAFFIPGKAMRRLLVATGPDGRPSCWLHRREDGEAAFPHSGKYARAATTLIARRAFECEQLAQAA